MQQKDIAFEKIIDELKSDIKKLKESRVSQTAIIPGAVKMRHMGEGNRFIRGGDSLPTTGENATDSVPVYFNTTDNKLYIWNPVTKTWKSATLT